MMKKIHVHYISDYIWIGTLSFVFLMMFLADGRMLSIPDEGRYVGIAVEMARTGDVVVPRLNGVQYLYKPPLFYWINALSISVFDNIVWASRLVPMLLAWITIMATVWFGKTFFNRATGIWAGVFLTTSCMWYVGSRSVNLDLAVASFIVLALYFYFAGLYEHNTRKQGVYAYVMYACVAGAVLTKGLVGLVLCGGVFFLHTVCTNGWKNLLKMRLITGIGLFLILVLPWHIFMYMANPEWFDFYIIREHFERFFTKVHGRYQPFWYFVPLLAVGLMPFGAFVVQPLLRFKTAWQNRMGKQGVEFFILIWVWLIVLFFSVSSSKLPLYVLPVVPPICIVAAQFLQDALRGNHKVCLSWSTGAYALFTIGVGLYAFVVVYMPNIIPEKDIPNITAVVQGLRPLIFILGFACMTHGLVQYIAVRKGVLRWGMMASVVLYIPVLLLINPIVSAVNKKSTYEVIKPLQHDHTGEEIILSRFLGDVPAYLNQHVSVVNYNGELIHFMDYEDVSDRHYDTQEFQRRWQSRDKKFLIVHKYADMNILHGMPYTKVAESHLYMLLTNH